MISRIKNFSTGFLLFLLVGQVLLPLDLEAQNTQNPIKLGIVAVTKNGQKQNTRATNTNQYFFDGSLNLDDAIRYQWEGVDLALRYIDNPSIGGGYLKIYKDEVKEDNFLLDSGRENYPIKLSEIADKLNEGKNTLQFVYVYSPNKQSYRPVSLTFDFEKSGDAPQLKVISPAVGSVFMPDLDNKIILELNNFKLTNTATNADNSGRLKVYYESINDNNLLGRVTDGETIEENKFRVDIAEDELDYSKVPDSTEMPLIFVLTNSAETEVIAQTELVIKSNFKETLNIGLPSVKFIEPAKDRSNLTVTESTKFMVNVENFNLLAEIKTQEGETKPNEGYLQIHITENGVTTPIQTVWPKTDFTLKEIGYLDSSSDNSGTKSVRVQLVNTNFLTLEPEAQDQLEIFYETIIISTANSNDIIENNTWRMIIISLTVLLIIGVITVLITKG